MAINMKNKTKFFLSWSSHSNGKGRQAINT